MTEMLTEVPIEYRQPVTNRELVDYGTPEFTAELRGEYGPTENAIANVAIEGSGLVDTSVQPSGYGEQLSIETEPDEQWRAADVHNRQAPRTNTTENYSHPQDLSPLEEANYVTNYIKHSKAHEEWTSGKIDSGEFFDRIADKSPRTYDQTLLRQNGQLFEQEKPFVDNPDLGVTTEDGTFWHGSNQLMEPGDRLVPSGEAPNAVHEANKSDRSFTSSSAPNGSSHRDEADFAFGYPREAGYLPSPYGKHIYKVSSPNSDIRHTSNGPEVWAEGGGRIEKRMHPDFVRNYNEANYRVNTDRFQPGLPGMENGMKFVSEKELDVSAKDFSEKYIYGNYEPLSRPVINHKPGLEDVMLPGLEEHGKHPEVPTPPSSSLM